jgi:KilA-N domain
MMKDSGHINISKMCKDAGKSYTDWSRLKSSQELIKAHEDTMALENTHGSLDNFDLTLVESQTADLLFAISTIIKINNNKSTEDEKLIAGTYLHPDLVPIVAGWISTSFQIYYL